jgi:hypothetical protein
MFRGTTITTVVSFALLVGWMNAGAASRPDSSREGTRLLQHKPADRPRLVQGPSAGDCLRLCPGRRCPPSCRDSVEPGLGDRRVVDDPVPPKSGKAGQERRSNQASPPAKQPDPAAKQ